MKTGQFCDVFGVEKPIVLAPMAGAVTPELVAAVSNAGGLGLAPLWRFDPTRLSDEVRKIQSLTDKPFGVNLNMDFPNMAQLEACLELKVPVISLFWHLKEEFVRVAKEGGAKVIYTAGSAAQAKAAVVLGVDAICAQGWEAGGHVRGTVGTMALVPAVADAVGDVPVIAAGGIADGRGVAAAFALGASAAWIGTRFLAAEEAESHPEYLRHLFAATENDTYYAENLFNIHWEDAPHRVLRNSTVNAWEAAGKPPPGERPSEGEVVAQSPHAGDVLRYASKTPDVATQGNIEAISMWAGQSVGQVNRVQPAADIVNELLVEARQINLTI